MLTTSHTHVLASQIHLSLDGDLLSSHSLIHLQASCRAAKKLSPLLTVCSFMVSQLCCLLFVTASTVPCQVVFSQSPFPILSSVHCTGCFSDIAEIFSDFFQISDFKNLLNHLTINYRINQACILFGKSSFSSYFYLKFRYKFISCHYAITIYLSSCLH